jgi:ATP-dependent RNA helicase SUPV3L1/SUV3
MTTNTPPLTKAGVFPTAEVMHRFADYFPPNTPLSLILTRLMDFGIPGTKYFVVSYRDIISVADAIHCVKNLFIDDRITICFSPVSASDKAMLGLTVEMARAVADQKGGGVLDIKGLNLELLDQEIVPQKSFLRDLETLHKGLVLYCWLSFRFPGVFSERALAMHAKGLTENAINKCLDMWKFNPGTRQERSEKRREAALVKQLASSFLDLGTQKDGAAEADAIQNLETSGLADLVESAVDESLPLSTDEDEILKENLVLEAEDRDQASQQAEFLPSEELRR